MIISKAKRVPARVRSRKLDRLVAHARMKKAGLRKVNKHDYTSYQTISGMTMQTRIGSYFSNHWREVATEEMNNM